MTAKLSAALAWTKDFLFENNGDKDWTFFTPSVPSVSLSTPAALWLMDSLLQGKNLGAKGQRLDCLVAGLKWSSGVDGIIPF